MPSKTILTVLAGGGFTFELRCLLQSMETDASFIYLAQEYGGRPGVDGIPPGDWYPVPMFATVMEPSRWLSVKAFIETFSKSFGILRRRKVDAVVGIGCSHLVPMFIAARLCGCRTVFIESITRADRLSTTGRLVYHARLADTFLVQWPELAVGLPRAALGSIL